MTLRQMLDTVPNLTPHELERLYANLRLEMNTVFTEDQVRHLDRHVDRDQRVREGSFL